MRILIAQSSFLGDVVLSTPVCAAVRRHYPAAHITMLVRPEVAGILDGHPHVDAVCIDDKRGRTRDKYGILTLPTTLFIDSAGVVQSINMGPTDRAQLERGIAAIMVHP